jgi:hypothetical protein
MWLSIGSIDKFPEYGNGSLVAKKKFHLNTNKIYDNDAIK